MMRRTLLAAFACVACGPAGAEEPLAKAAIVKRSKPAIVFVDAKTGTGSGFCIHESGLFVTNNHVVANVKHAESVTLVLDAGGKDQKVVKADLIRRDAALDLALLRLDTKDKLPALELGADDKLAELDELISFGFPFGTALSRDDFPAVTVGAAGVSSLRKDRDGALNRIQIDGALNPGHSGGPVVDRSGKVVGVVVSGIPGSGIALAIPVTHVRKFLERPDMILSAPRIDPKDREKPAEYKATVAGFLPPDRLYDVELVIGTADGERRHPMKREGGRYIATATAFAPLAEIRPRVEIRFPDGSVTTLVRNAAFTVAGRKLTLEQVRSVRFGSAPRAVLDTGESVEGKLEGLDSLAITVGEASPPLLLNTATELLVTPPGPRGSYVCTLVARIGDREMGRLEAVKFLDGLEPGGTDELLKGNFVRPGKALKPLSFMKFASAPGDFIGQGGKFRFEKSDMKVTANRFGGVTVQTEDGRGWTFETWPAKGETLKAGEYRVARKNNPDRDAVGLQVTGLFRAPNDAECKFTVWELEIKDGEVVKCAIDFSQDIGGRGKPLVGVIRVNSSFE